jgi:flagellar biosynthesis chaperone FliJ
LKPFQFKLERVLEWQAAQLLIEEVELRRLRREVADLASAATALEASRLEAENKLRGETRLNGSDLRALEAYRLRLRKQEESLRARRVEAEKRVSAQMERLLTTQRKHRLLEKLRKRRHDEWLLESNREIERVAAETYLARFSREN